MNPFNIIAQWLGRDNTATAHHLYGAIVSQARQPIFYRDFAVPDTLDGRFDMIVLFAALLFRRLRQEQGGAGLAQQVFDLMFKDMDHSLREMGVGDLSVPKKVRAMGEAFYGRAAAYDAALDTDVHGVHDALTQAIARNVYGQQADGGALAGALARYVMEAQHCLHDQAFARLCSGAVDFPPIPAPAAA